MSNYNKNLEEAEKEYLKFFFENAKISMQERIFLEEGFELCFNYKVPESLKINLEKEKQNINPIDHLGDTIRCPSPGTDSQAKTPLINLEIDEVNPDVEDVKIPGPPKVPEMTMMGRMLLDNAENGDYVLMHKGSGEHVSLDFLINQLKSMTGIE